MSKQEQSERWAKDGSAIETLTDSLQELVDLIANTDKINNTFWSNSAPVSRAVQAIAIGKAAL